MRNKLIILMGILLATPAFASESPGAPSNASKECHSDPKLVAACFKIRGRLSFYNGIPTVRIWKVGTKRMLGITEHLNSNGYATTPENLLDKMNFETDMFADFMVCPYTKEDPEVMQLICVDSANNITLKSRQ